MQGNDLVKSLSQQLPTLAEHQSLWEASKYLENLSSFLDQLSSKPRGGGEWTGGEMEVLSPGRRFSSAPR